MVDSICRTRGNRGNRANWINRRNWSYRSNRKYWCSVNGNRAYGRARGHGTNRSSRY